MNLKKRTDAEKPNKPQEMKFLKLKGKAGLHKDNRHRGRYDFKVLTKLVPTLQSRIKANPRGDMTIDFSDALSVKLLNQALLKQHYQIEYWDIPKGYLCPPIPGRADYIHRLADLLNAEQGMASSSLVRTLDIGVGANGIYPLIGNRVYGWQGVGSDIDPISVKNAQEIFDGNASTSGQIECRLQRNNRYLFKGIIGSNDFFHLTTCNPPFHASAQEAINSSVRKQSNLSNNRKAKGLGDKKTTSSLNFGGQHNELWCDGGEAPLLSAWHLKVEIFLIEYCGSVPCFPKKRTFAGCEKTCKKRVPKKPE